jgi:hypothetical protein
MKITEINDITVYVSNAEKKVLDTIRRAGRPLHSFSEHEQFIIDSLVRKDLVIKEGDIYPRVFANENKKTS